MHNIACRAGYTCSIVPVDILLWPLWCLTGPLSRVFWGPEKSYNPIFYCHPYDCSVLLSSRPTPTAQWAEQQQCTSNTAFMRHSCAASCRICEPAGAPTAAAAAPEAATRGVAAPGRGAVRPLPTAGTVIDGTCETGYEGYSTAVR